MRRIVMSLTLVAALALILGSSILCSPRAQENKAPPIIPQPGQKLTPLPVLKAEGNSPLSKVSRRENFPKLSDTKTTLRDVLDLTKQLFDLRFTINEKAFEADGTKDPASIPIAEARPLEALENARLDTILEAILSRIPTATGATFLVRRDCIEITTGRFVQNEIWGENMKNARLPIVNIRIDNRPLEEALALLADESQLTIVLDKRVEEKARAPVTARFLNTPVDTAVRFLAEMADLRMVHLDNVLFVTTRTDAALLEKSMDKERPVSEDPNEWRLWRKGGERGAVLMGGGVAGM